MLLISKDMLLRRTVIRFIWRIMNTIRKKSLGLIICVLLLATSLLSTGIGAALKICDQPLEERPTRIVGFGIYDRSYSDKIKAPYLHTIWAVCNGHCYGPGEDFDLFQMGFRGFVIPIVHCPTPIIGIFTYYTPWPNPPWL